MSTEHDPVDSKGERDEELLRALFDETAPEPEPAALQRMARAAALIPEARQPWYRKLWIRRPLAIGALVAAAALAVMFNMSDEQRVPTEPFAKTSSDLPDAPAPSASSEDSLDELLAFELTDNGEDELAVLDADPLAAWDGADDDPLDDDSVSALDLLFVDDLADVELLGSAFDDVLTEGG